MITQEESEDRWPDPVNLIVISILAGLIVVVVIKGIDTLITAL